MLYKLASKIINMSLKAIRPPHLTINVSTIERGELLKGKRILITGGSRGIGLAMAKKFLNEGATVLITGRNESKLSDIVKDCNNNRLYYIAFDVNNISGISSLYDSAGQKLGGVDILVSNAGISLHEGSIDNVSSEGFDQTISTNLKSHYFLAKEFIKRHKQDENKTILFVTSKDGYVCNEIPYGLTKASVNSLVGALSCHYYRQGIRVNAIAPGVTLTDMTRSFADRGDGNMYAANYAGRNFLPQEVAEVACFLISDVSRCISGQIIYTDGGDHNKSNIKV